MVLQVHVKQCRFDTKTFLHCFALIAKLLEIGPSVQMNPMQSRSKNKLNLVVICKFAYCLVDRKKD